MTHHIHSFHIPVMGTAFTVDSPIKVARFGISSVISIGDNELCENMREFYCNKLGRDFTPIPKHESVNYRSDRITAYLNLVQDIVDEQMAEMKALPFEGENDLVKYFELLPDTSPLRLQYEQFCRSEDASERDRLEAELKTQLKPGEIEVNLMTKIDRLNYSKEGELLGPEFSDASCILRGFAQSKLRSSIVFSAGFNRRLYAGMEAYDDFYPDADGTLKKRVIMKVSDVRSSLTQGKFLAKKGIWISEHRIESGLNCGGHAFASDGFLLGPILEEFKEKRHELSETFLATCNATLSKKGRVTFDTAPSLEISVQGGIGTAKENQFLLDYFKVDGTGWATPFLLVPEASTIDSATRDYLAKATGDDLFLSDFSPLGVPFNSIKNSASEIQKKERIEAGRPGSPCPKGHLVSDLEFTKKPICTASTTYQRRKIAQLNDQKDSMSEEAYQDAFDAVVVKSCLCEDLAAGALIDKHMENKRPLKTAVCPGPNLAYFSKFSTLAEMVHHIYGRINLLNDTYRPNMFISELKMYVNYLGKEIKKSMPNPDEKRKEYLEYFKQNILDGIAYYKEMIPKLEQESVEYRAKMEEELLGYKAELEALFLQYQLV